MCFKKWFGKEEEVVEVVEEVVEKKPVEELVESIQGLVVQLNLVVEENKKLEEKVKQLEEVKEEKLKIIEMLDGDRNKEHEEACAAKEQVEQLLKEKNELERRLTEILELAKGE